MIGVFGKHGNRRQRREKKRQTPAADQADRGQRCEQQQAQAAADPAARMHEQDYKENVRADLHRELHGEIRLAQDDCRKGQQAEDDVARARVQESLAAVGPEGNAVAERHYRCHQYDRDAQAITIEIEQRAPERVAILAALERRKLGRGENAAAHWTGGARRSAAAVPVGQLEMFLAAIDLAAGGDGFALWQVHAADPAANHVLPVFCCGRRRRSRLDPPAIAAQEQIHHDEDGDD